MTWLSGVSAAVVLALFGYALGTLCMEVIAPVWQGPEAYVRAGAALFLGGMSAWSYLVAGLRPSQLHGEVDATAFRTVKRSTGMRRWCSKCSAPKPDRCHHCRKCKRCILKMDHHCPWVMDTCIGLQNYHAFLLLLGYTTLFCTYTLYTLVAAFMALLVEPRDEIPLPVSWIVLAAIALVFGLALLPFLLFHVYLVSVNRTTLEYIEGMERIRCTDEEDPASTPSSRHRLARFLTQGSDSESREQLLPMHSCGTEPAAQRLAKRYNLYNRGMRANWRQILGPHAWLWWAPLETPVCDGIHFEIDDMAWAQLQNALRFRDS